MEHVTIGYERGGAVRRVVIDRPDKRNALSREMFATLTREFEREPPASEAVTVIESTGHVFCSGIDLNERLAHGAPPLAELCEAISAYPLPVVARVQGDAIAGGAFLALACDFIVADEAAKLWVSLVQIGLAPPWPLTRRLARIAGPQFARELALLGDPVSCARLAEGQVVTAAVPASDLAATTEAMIDRLARNAPLSLRAIKATLIAGDDDDPAPDAVERMIASARDSQDGREGVSARLERRAPHFSGR
jgi:enoyl-CoA hydratase/carnithine racemase